MKIALCLSGYFNSPKSPNSFGEDGFEYIKKHILNGNTVDVFIHSWDISNKDIIERLYDNLIKDCPFEEIPIKYKKEVSKLYNDANKYIPLQLNGTIGMINLNSPNINVIEPINV